jgi:hypothetical protein
MALTAGLGSTRCAGGIVDIGFVVLDFGFLFGLAAA